MNQPGWLDDRRWRWRIIVLIIMLVVVGLLFWQGHDLIAALGSTVVIFIVAAKVIPWIIDSPMQGRTAPPRDPADAPLDRPGGPAAPEQAGTAEEAGQR